MLEPNSNGLSIKVIQRDSPFPKTQHPQNCPPRSIIGTHLCQRRNHTWHHLFLPSIGHLFYACISCSSMFRVTLAYEFDTNHNNLYHSCNPLPCRNVSLVATRSFISMVKAFVFSNSDLKFGRLNDFISSFLQEGCSRLLNVGMQRSHAVHWLTLFHCFVSSRQRLFYFPPGR